MLLFAAVACGVILSVDSATGSQQVNASKDAEEVFVNRCGSCHGTDRALVARRTRKGWESVLGEMANIGATLEPGEQETILAFLTERHGLVNVNTAAAEDLVGLELSKKDADTIVSYRAEHGAFADFAALQKVPGLDRDRVNAARERMAFRD